MQMFVNIQQLLKENNPRKSGGYDFISISKTITNENMGKDNSFTNADLTKLKEQSDYRGNCTTDLQSIQGARHRRRYYSFQHRSFFRKY